MLNIILSILLALNSIAYNHAYNFTNLKEISSDNFKRVEQLSTLEKITKIIIGSEIPKLKNNRLPKVNYETISLKDKNNNIIESWLLRTKDKKGTIVFFSGFLGIKSNHLEQAYFFQKLGYQVLLVDLQAHGGSSGTKSTYGFQESENVKAVFDYLNKSEKNIIFWATSMGAGAVLKSIDKYKFSVNYLILEKPFTSLITAMNNRFRILKIPTFPLSDFIVFWIGVQNNFLAINHNAINYAKSIDSPTLIIHGGKDKKMLLSDVKKLYKNIPSEKKIIVIKSAKHQSFFNSQFQKEWEKEIIHFLNKKTN